MKAEVAEPLSGPLFAHHADREPIPIFLLDFLVGTFNASGVNRTIGAEFPELADQLQVTQIYYQDTNPDISRGGYRNYVEARDIAGLKSSAIVQVCCAQQQAVFLLGSTPAACLPADAR